MIFHVLTIFPDFFEGPFAHGVVAGPGKPGWWKSGSTI